MVSNLFYVDVGAMSANPMPKKEAVSERDPAEIMASIREQFRDDYEFAMRPFRDILGANYDNAIKFADGIKALFSLNGGGLIALPAFATLFKPDMRTAAVWIGWAMVAFVIGLVGAALTSLFGYKSAIEAVEATHNRLTAMGTR